jgi:hypothetical protein
MYGANDPWLPLFEQFGGTIEAVEGDGILGSESDWDCYVDLLRPQDNHPIIQLQFSLQRPFIAATHLRQQLLDVFERSAPGPCDFGYRMEGLLIDQAFEAAAAQEHARFDETIQTYDQLRMAAFEYAVAATAAISNVYISSVGIVSEGVDVVLTLHDLSQGQYASAIGLLPFISAPMVSAAKITIVAGAGTAAATVAYVVGDVVRHFPPGVSDIGWVKRYNMPRRVRGPAGRKPAVILGLGQDAGGASGAEHAAHSEHLANVAADVGDVEYITLHRELRTATGLDNLGNAGGKLPDLVVVRRDANGSPKVDLYEIQSCNEWGPAGFAMLQAELDEMMSVLPPEIQGNKKLVPLTDYFNPANCN